MELQIRVKEYILISLEDIKGTFSSMEENRSKKINLHALYIYRLDEKTKQTVLKSTFLVTLCCNKSRLLYQFSTLSSTGLTS